MIVEGGNFNWAEVPGKFPTLTEPDPTYHGLTLLPRRLGARPPSSPASAPSSCATPSCHPLPLRRLPAAAGHRRPSPCGVERHVQNALRVVEYLSDRRPEVETV